jgi:hypothetical protein
MKPNFGRRRQRKRNELPNKRRIDNKNLKKQEKRKLKDSESTVNTKDL